MKLNRLVNLTILAVILGLTVSLWLFYQVQAQGGGQSGRIDAFTFFVPFPSESLDNLFDNGYNGGLPNPPGDGNYIGFDIETVISIAVRRGGTIIFYDHWEDGYEADIANPTQSTTRVWGDGNPANNGPEPVIGIPANDLLVAGDVIRLQNRVDLPLPGGGRDRSVIFFDGGDALTAEDGSVAVTEGVWPMGPPPDGDEPGILYADAWELLPTERWGTEYLISVGQDLAAARDGSFAVVGLSVQALADGTTVEIDLNDGSGPTTVTLNQATFPQRAYSVVQGVNVGASVRVTDGGPVQVHVLTADPDSEWEARAFTMYPVDELTDQWLAPRSSDGDFWLYNPHDTELEVAVETSITGTVFITIPARSTVRYFFTTDPDPTVPDPYELNDATGTLFSSTDGRPFNGVVALDESQVQDWGYALLPVDLLTSQVLVAWGVGNAPNGDINNPPGPVPLPPPGPAGDATGDESPVYVTALEDTEVIVIYADGSQAGPISVPRLTEVILTAPNHDMTGAFIYSVDGTPFGAVWGQDGRAPVALPSIDVGTGIAPIQSLTIQKTYELIIDVDCNGTITPRDTVQFELLYLNNTASTVTGVIVQDILPDALSYVPDTIEVNGNPRLDASGATDLFGEGLAVNDPIPPFEAGIVTFNAVVNGAPPFINEGIASADIGPLRASDSVAVLIPEAETTAPILVVDQNLIDPPGGPVTVGQQITFELTISNVSDPAVSIVTLPVHITFNEEDLAIVGTSVATDSAGPGAIEWTDLLAATGSGPLLPGQTISLTSSYTVTRIPANNSTTLTTTVLYAEREDGDPPLICPAFASVNVAVPPTPTPRPERDDDDDPTPTPPPATPVAEAFAPPPAQLPVAFLPETGLLETSSLIDPVWGGGIIIVLTLTGTIGIIMAVRRKKKQR